MAKASAYLSDLRVMIQHLRAVSPSSGVIVGTERICHARQETPSQRSDLEQTTAIVSQPSQRFMFTQGCSVGSLAYNGALEKSPVESDSSSKLSHNIRSLMKGTGLPNIPSVYIADSHEADDDTAGHASSDVMLASTGDLSDLQKNLHQTECQVQICSKRLQRGLMRLFPNRCVPENGLTAMTINQHTEHSMASWSSDVEEEREVVLARFLTAAQLVCEHLSAKGYWADFIDPSSGRAFYGVYSNETFYETDERMRHLGYSIEDLGCCKCLAHGEWGTNIFAGIIITDAAPDSTVMQKIMNLRQLLPRKS